MKYLFFFFLCTYFSAQPMNKFEMDPYGDDSNEGSGLIAQVEKKYYCNSNCVYHAKQMSCCQRLRSNNNQEDLICECGSDQCASVMGSLFGGWGLVCLVPFECRTQDELNDAFGASPDQYCMSCYKNRNKDEHHCIGQGCSECLYHGASCAACTAFSCLIGINIGARM